MISFCLNNDLFSLIETDSKWLENRGIGKPLHSEDGTIPDRPTKVIGPYGNYEIDKSSKKFFPLFLHICIQNPVKYQRLTFLRK